MTHRRRKRPRDAKPPGAADDEAMRASLADDLLRAIREVVTIPGVDGIGQPVTVLSPYDLPPDLLGFVERLRAGAVEEDEEMLLVTIPAPRVGGRGEHPTADRLRQALSLLCLHALDCGVPTGDVMALLDGAKRGIVAKGPSRGGRTRRDTEPTTGAAERPLGDN
jgi:hypothetical protein